MKRRTRTHTLKTVQTHIHTQRPAVCFSIFLSVYIIPERRDKETKRDVDAGAKLVF